MQVLRYLQYIIYMYIYCIYVCLVLMDMVSIRLNDLLHLRGFRTITVLFNHQLIGTTPLMELIVRMFSLRVFISVNTNTIFIAHIIKQNHLSLYMYMYGCGVVARLISTSSSK